MRVSTILTVVGLMLGAAACGGGSSGGVSKDTGTETAADEKGTEDVVVREAADERKARDEGAADDKVDVPVPPEEVGAEEEAQVVPPDVPDTSDATEELVAELPEELPEDVQTDELQPEELEVQADEVAPVNPLPKSLPLHWINIQNNDMVTVKKKIVVEFEVDTPMPENKAFELMYNAKFETIATYWDAENSQAGAEVTLKKTWRKIVPGMFRRPALVLEPASGQWDPTQPYRITIWLGNQLLDVVFHTLPQWTPGYKVVEMEVPVPTDCETECGGDCAKCFPFPIGIHIFVPPEYNSTDANLNNTSLPWINTEQRYPVMIGLHGYNGQGMSMADAYGWKTLPRFSSQGVVEPMLVILVDGTVPAQYCGSGWPWPGTGGNTCYTQFLGIGAAIPNETSFVSYSFWLANTLKKYMAQHFRVRGMDDAGNILDEDEARRAYALTGLSGGGWGALLNAFMHPEAYGAVYGLMPTTASFFNPYAYWYQGGSPTYEQICNKADNAAYPYVPYGSGYRDMSMIDPDTGKTRDITIDMREIKPGAKSCFWWSPQVVSNAIVKALLCGMDVTCGVDQGAPDYWKTDFDTYPFDGNILFTTGIRDFEGPPAAFFDLDQQLDKRGVIHSFRYEDQGGVYHDWQAIYDQVVGRYEIQWQDGTISPGNYPGTGLLYPFTNAAVEGIGNHPFNHPFASEFTTGGLDPDRDYWIDCDYPDLPDLKFVEDNCPGVYNPDQADEDEDGQGDVCD